MSGFPEDESAWLIEMDGPLYWSGRDGCRAWWSVADAVRFCRWDDADRLRRLMGFEKARVREHVWPRTVMPAVVRPVPSVEPEPPPAPAQAGWTLPVCAGNADTSAHEWNTCVREAPRKLGSECVRCGVKDWWLEAPKVRVRLPEPMPLEFPVDVAAAHNRAVRACAAALRQAGVEIEGEQ